MDCHKAKREIDLHWRASGCVNIVNIIDVYENEYMDKKCLLVVMEWYVFSISNCQIFVLQQVNMSTFNLEFLS